jgi:anti-sigma regulatory factor (Ser/Thr protein kinase)
MSQNIQLNIPIAWEYVRTVRQQVARALTEYPEELRSAAVMVSSELVENAIKYGAAVPGLTWAEFRFEVTPERIQVQVSNGITDLGSWHRVNSMVKQMQQTTTCEQLYVSRLQTLVNNPMQSTQLGLYRIGYEGQFVLDCTYTGQVLTMTATRLVP